VTLEGISAGDVDIDDSYVYAGDSDFGGSITVNAENGNVYISDSYLAAYQEGTVGGNVNITASGTVSIDNDSTIYADNEVNITAGGDVDISDSKIYFNGGAGQTYSGGQIYESSQNEDISFDSGEITLTAGGNMNLQDSEFVASGDVSISDETITVLYGDINIDTGAEVNLIDPNGTLTMSGVEVVGGDIDISGSGITAYGGDVNIGGSGEVLFNGGSVGGGYTAVAGVVSIMDSDIIASGGDVDINSGGTVAVQADSHVYEIVGDNVTVNAGGDVDLYDATIRANTGGDLNITAEGTLNMDDAVGGVTALSGDDVTLSGDGDVLLDWNSATGGATITANDGDVLVESADGDVLAENVAITADGGIQPVELLESSGDVDVYADYGNVDFENSTVTALSGDVDIEAGYSDAEGSETLTMGGDIVTAGGSVTLNAPGSVTLTGGSVTGNDSVNVTGDSGITINGTAVSADDTTYGQINLTTTSGQTTIQNGTSMTAYNLTVNSPDGILIDGSGGGTLSGNTMSLTAGGGDASGGPAITVNNEDLTAFQTINMSAHTVNLLDVAFGGSSTVNLHSYFGALASNPNTGQSSVPGYVNFINNVTYGGDAAQNHVGSGINISGL
jgi:hypothetical protein